MNRALRDRVFTAAVNAVQQYVTPLGVRVKQRRRRRHVAPPSTALRKRLAALGLDVDALWWGPMTLFPRKAEYLMSEIEAAPPRRVLEVGSGSSTPVLAALAARHGFGIVSLENHEGSARYVRAALQGSPGESSVELVVAGFRRRHYPDGKGYWWYDIDLGRHGAPFDLVIIDGPMGTLVGRNGAIPEIFPFLTACHRIYLDDANRAHEQACMDEWLARHPFMTVERPATCRGMAKITLPIAG